MGNKGSSRRNKAKSLGTYCEDSVNKKKDKIDFILMKHRYLNITCH